MNADLPTEIKLHKQSSTLELVFANDVEFRLSSEYLRVHSPSAEVRGHGSGSSPDWEAPGKTSQHRNSRQLRH